MAVMRVEKNSNYILNNHICVNKEDMVDFAVSLN